MSQVAVSGSLSQSKEALLKSYQKRLKDDIKSMLDNYVEIIKLGKVCHIGMTKYRKGPQRTAKEHDKGLQSTAIDRQA